MHLNHNDITGWEQTERAELESVARQVSIWQDRIEAGSPSLRVREPFILAQHELHVNGGYGQSILASSIGVEVLCYLVAVSLLWEEHRNDPTCPGEVEVAEHLASKDYAWVAESVIRTRLGGNWNRDGKSSYHERDAIQAHLTVVVTALAVARHLQAATGLSIKKIVQTLRPLQQITVNIAGHEHLAQDPLPDTAREILTATSTDWPTH